MHGHAGSGCEKSQVSLRLEDEHEHGHVFRGFGFITFTDPTSVDKVLTQEQHELDGKKVREGGGNLLESF